MRTLVRGNNMSLLMTQYIRLFSLFSFLCVGLILVTPLYAKADSKDRTLFVELWKDEPVKIVDIESSHGSLKNGKTVIRDEFWLENLSLRVKNISDKNVVSFSYVLTIYGNGKSGQKRIGTLISYDNSTNREIVVLAPNQQVTLYLEPNILHSFKKTLETRNQTMNDVIKVKLSLQEVCFDDNTCWFGESVIPAETIKNDKLETNEISQRTTVPCKDCNKIKPQIGFCGKVSTTLTIPCCSCPGGTTFSCRQYVLQEAQPSETTYYICDFICSCSCPEPGGFTNYCIGHEIKLCSGSLQTCDEF